MRKRYSARYDTCAPSLSHSHIYHRTMDGRTKMRNLNQTLTLVTIFFRSRERAVILASYSYQLTAGRAVRSGHAAASRAAPASRRNPAGSFGGVPTPVVQCAADRGHVPVGGRRNPMATPRPKSSRSHAHIPSLSPLAIVSPAIKAPGRGTELATTRQAASKRETAALASSIHPSSSSGRQDQQRVII